MNALIGGVLGGIGAKIGRLGSGTSGMVEDGNPFAKDTKIPINDFEYLPRI